MLVAGVSSSGEALKAAIAGKVSYDLSPMSVSVVADLPMTPTGKIAKGELAAFVTSVA
jgi:acyl-coenzyme A synthetase/AMP-(fatty) acid ligase